MIPIVVGDTWSVPYGTLGKLRTMANILCTGCANIFGPIPLGKARYNGRVLCQACTKDAQRQRRIIEMQNRLLTTAKDLNINVDVSSYYNEKSVLDFTCSTCGNVWKLKAGSFMVSKACSKCSRTHMGITRASKCKESFLADIHSMHGDKISVDITSYTNTSTHVDATCTVCNLSWKITPTNLKKGYGCPNCNIGWAFHRENITTPTKFYVLYLPKYRLYKVGITSRPLKIRYASEHLEYIEVLSIEFKTGAEAFYIEKLMKQQNKLNKYQGPPVLKHGNTEVYTDIYIGNTDILRDLATERLIQLKELNDTTPT